MEGDKTTADGLVAVPQEVPADQIDNEGEDAENAECPAQTQTGYHGANGKGVYQSA